MKNPYDIIKIDKNTKKIQTPSLLLMNRAFDIIGKISNYTNWNISLVGNGLDEISFEVHKYSNGILCPVWDDLVDLKIVDVRTFGRFEISVNYTDNTETVKSVHGVSLETELGQIPLYEFHVNDEDATDMEITEYSESNYDKKGNFVPTVFYNENDPKHSLLHRVLADKAPHWSIGTVPDFIILEDQKPEPVETFQRTYTCDGDTIYDFLTGTVAEESNVVFIFDTINRKINCYNLCEYNDAHGSTIGNCIGEDTNVFISKRKLANEITISSNKDNVKNCFRIEGGDDIITDYVRAVNMNGSNYIYQFADFQFKDMPDELVQKIKSYNEEMETHREEYYGSKGIDDFVSGLTGVKVESFEDFNLIQIIMKGSKINTETITPYTEFVKDYPKSSYWYVDNNNLTITDSYDTASSHCTTIVTVDELFESLGVYTQLCEKYDELLYYESEMMPAVNIAETDAQTQYNKMVNELTDMTVGVSSLNNDNNELLVRATSNIEAMAQILVDSRYKVEVIENTASYNSTTKKWTGNIRVTNTADEADYYPKTDDEINNPFTIDITDDEEQYVKQKLQKALSKGSMLDIDFKTEEIWGSQKKQITKTITLNRGNYSNCIKCDGYFRISNLNNLSDGCIVCETYDWEGKLINTINNIKNAVTIDTNNVSYVKLFYSHDKNSVNITYVSQEPDLTKVKEYFSLYSLNRLKSFYDGYNSCLSILMTMGKTTTSDVLNELHYNYFWRRATVEEVHNQRQQEVDKINSKIDEITVKQKNFQCEWNFQEYLEKDAPNDNLYEIFCSYRREDSYKNDNYISDGLSTSECLQKAKELVDAANIEIKKSCVLQRTVSTSLNNLLLLPEFESLYDKFALFNYIRIRTEDEILKLRLIGVDFDGESVENINVTFAEQIESVDGKINDLQSIIQQASSIASSYSSTTLQAKQGANANNVISEMYNSGLNAAKTMLANNDNNEVTITSAGILCKRMDDEGYYGEKQLRITGNIIGFTRDNWQSVEMAIGETSFTNPITKESKTAYGIIAENLVGKMLVGENAYIGNSDGSVQITGSGIKIKDKNDTEVFNVDNNGEAYFKGKIEAKEGYFQGAIDGGYLYIKDKRDIGNTNISIEINPNGTASFDGHNSDYVFNVSKDGVPIMGVTNDGNGYFQGAITGGYLHISKDDGYSVTIDPLGKLKTGNNNIFNIRKTEGNVSIMGVTSQGEGFFTKQIVLKNEEEENLGQFDIGKFPTPDKIQRKGIGIVSHINDKGYIGFGFKPPGGGTTLGEWIEIDNNKQRHIFGCEVNFNTIANFYGGGGLRLYPDFGDGNKWSTLKYNTLNNEEAIYTDNHFVCNKNISCNGRAGQFSGTNHANATSLGMTTGSFNEVFPNNDVYWCYQEFGGIVIAQCTGTLAGETTVGTIHWFPTPMLSVEDTRVADNGQNTVRGYINRDGLTLKNTASGNAFFALNFVYIKYT